jgi:hypothetical protein
MNPEPSHHRERKTNSPPPKENNPVDEESDGGNQEEQRRLDAPRPIQNGKQLEPNKAASHLDARLNEL